MAEKQVNRYAEMVVACDEAQHYKGEKMPEEHTLLRVVSGSLKVVQANRSYTLLAGDTLLFPRNQLATLIKSCHEGRPYRSVIITLDGARLRDHYTRKAFNHIKPRTHEILTLPRSPLLDSYFASMLPYFDLETALPDKLVCVKIEEAIEILRSIDPDIDGILSDLSQPGKINLADFMEKNFMFNISLEKFSLLTGRSLTTFKRDFKNAFHTAPQKWLTQKRLELAHYQLSEKKRKPNDVYYEAGFENLSHFSHAFKRHYGYPPTLVDREGRGTH